MNIDLKKIPTLIISGLVSLILLYVAGQIAYSLLLSIPIPSMEGLGVPKLEISGWLMVVMLVAAVGIVFRGVVHNDSYKGAVFAANTVGVIAFTIGIFVLIVVLIFGSQTPEVIGGVRDRIRNATAPVFDANYVPTYSGGTLHLQGGESKTVDVIGTIRVNVPMGYAPHANPPIFRLIQNSTNSVAWFTPCDPAVKRSTISLITAAQVRKLKDQAPNDCS